MNLNIDAALEKVLDKLELWRDTLLSMLPNMVVATLLFIAFVVMAKLGRKLFRRVFSRVSDNVALENLFATIIFYMIVGLGLFLVLGILQLEKTVTSLLAGIGVLGLALGFAFQDITANFVSGVILAFRKPFEIGEIIEVQGIMGTVTRTNLRVTVIQTFQGQEVYIPNKDVLQGNIMNYTKLGKRRIDLAVGVSYGDDLDKVEALVKKAILNMEGVIDHDNLIFDYYEFGDSSINFNIRFWIEYPGQKGFFKMRHQAIKNIKATFDQHDITIPFPIRTLDFGIKGGEKLSEMPLRLTENGGVK